MTDPSFPGPTRVALARAGYAAAVHALLGPAAVRQVWRDRHEPASWARLPERLGRGPATAPGALWVHAVSVGEVVAAQAVLAVLRERDPDLRVLLTTVTAAGARRAQALLRADDAHRFLPWDTSWAVRAFLRRHRPCAGVLLETELWPQLLRACDGAGIALALINARLSARSARGYARLPALVRPMLKSLHVVGAQAAPDAQRLVALGVAAERVHVTGNLKFDIPDPGPEPAATLRAQCAGRPVWMAGSTHPGEEALVLEAHRQVRAVRPDALLLLAPRHPQRFEAAARLCVQAGFDVTRRSVGASPADAGVHLLDTLGELAALYGAAQVAFVGGSLVPVGGHSLIEPANCGVPSLFGPHLHNFSALRAQVLDAGAGCEVRDAATLARAVLDLMARPQHAAHMGAAGRALVAAQRGAAQRSADLLAPLLG